MNKTLISIAAIFSVGLLGAFALFLQYNRFDLANVGAGTIYKIDRKTGRTWMVVANREVDILPEEHESAKDSKERSLDLGKAAFRVDYFIKSALVDRVKKSKALVPDVTVEAFIGSQVSKLNRPLDLRGWDAVEKAPAPRRRDSQSASELDVLKGDSALWMVSYTYDLGQGFQGYYFEVDPKSGDIHAVSANPRLQEKYGVHCETFLCFAQRTADGKKETEKKH